MDTKNMQNLKADSKKNLHAPSLENMVPTPNLKGLL